MRQVRGLSGSQANPIPLTPAANETGSLAMVDPSQRSTMLTLLLEILDISDQLPLEAVDSSARNVTFWKAFAAEAGKCTTYPEVGSFLPRLHAKIIPTYIKTRWTNNRYHQWKKDCERSATGSIVEALTKELVDAVLWDKVKKLWNSATQAELNVSEWQHWKGTVFEGLQQQQVPADDGNDDAQVQNHPGVETTPVGARGPSFATGLTPMNVAGYDALRDSSIAAADVDGSEDRCAGMTKRGIRCTHKTKGGAKFCGKHAILGFPPNEPLHHASLDVVAFGSGNDQEIGSLKRKRSPRGPSGLHATDSREGKRQCVDPEDAPTICRGWSRRTNAPCARRAGKFSLYCHKHMKNAEVPTRTVTDTARGISTHKEEGRDSERAQSSLHELMSAAEVSWNTSSGRGIVEASREKLFREASTNLSFAESLLTLTLAEKERLKNDLRVQQDSVQTCPPGDCHLSNTSCDGHVESVPPEHKQKFLVDADAMGESCVVVTAQRQLMSCALCEKKFEQKEDLRTHWSSDHEQQASLFLKSFSCRVCRFETSSAQVVERHWRKHHKHIPQEWPSWCVCIACEEAFCDEEELWEHVTDLHIEQLLRHANQDAGLETWKPFWKSSEEAAHQEMGWRCTTSYKEFASEPEISGPEDGDPVDGSISKTIPFTSCVMNAPAQLPEPHQLQPEKWSTETTLAPDGTSPFPHESLRPVRIREKKGAIRGRGRGRKRMGLNGRQQNGGSSESESAFTPAEDLFKRRRLMSNAGGLQEEPKEVTSIVGGDVVQNVIRESTFGVSCKLEQSMVEAKPSSGSLVEQVDDGIRNSSDVSDASKQRADVNDGLQTTLVAIDVNSVMKSRTSAFCGDVSANSAHCVVLSPDISLGQELVPVPCVVTTDAFQCSCTICENEKECDVSKLKPWESFVYCTNRLVDPALGIDTKESRLGCLCDQDYCAPELCDHVKMFDTDNQDALDLHGHPMQGRFPYDKDRRILLEEGFLVYECNSSCHCSKQCQNRVLQNGVQVKLEVYKTRHKGWGVRAAQLIPQGTFVCEYIGEVLNNEEANKRGERYDELGCSYLYDIDVHLDTSRGLSSKRQRYVIDATKYGNVSRFINHSCSPNLVNYQVLVESMDCRLAHIGLFASREIAVGEELAYNYRYKLLPGKGCPCQCGSTDCRKRLY